MFGRLAHLIRMLSYFEHDKKTIIQITYDNYFTGVDDLRYLVE